MVRVWVSLFGAEKLVSKETVTTASLLTDFEIRWSKPDLASFPTPTIWLV